MDVVKRGTVFVGKAGTEFSSACFPSICALPGGRWLAGFRASPKKSDARPQKVMLTWSDDEGATWSRPIEPFAAPSIGGKPGDFRAAHPTSLGGKRVLAVLCWVDASNPTLPFFNAETEGLLDTRIFLSVSEDAGLTWCKPWQVDTRPYADPTPITGPVKILRNGEWAVQFETNKPYYDMSVWHHSSVLMFSRDRGKTWPEHVKVTCDPEARFFYWDQRPGVLRDGTVLDVFWTFDRVRAEYLHIHACASKDNGRRWSELWDTGIPGQPGPPVQLADGRIAMPYMDRTTVPILKMRTSADGGRSWPDDTEVILDDSAGRAQEGQKSSMQDAWAEMAKYSVGLPYTALLPDRSVLVLYYAGTHMDHTGIRWVRVRP